MYFKTLNSPLGPITLFAESDNIVALEFGSVLTYRSSPLLEVAISQLRAYFNGSLKNFNLPLKASGTDFQKSVWNSLLEIQYGSSSSYGDIAINVNSSPRAVGGACGKNPIPIIIPCHRVLATNSKVGGFRGDGGIRAKIALLHIEGINIKNLHQ